eukprot:scaffold12455_cov62-Phaeocystis_antarctica.AAC.12
MCTPGGTARGCRAGSTSRPRSGRRAPRAWARAARSAPLVEVLGGAASCAHLLEHLQHQRRLDHAGGGVTAQRRRLQWRERHGQEGSVDAVAAQRLQRCGVQQREHVHGVRHESRAARRRLALGRLVEGDHLQRRVSPLGGHALCEAARLPVALVRDVEAENEAEARDERDQVEGVRVLEELEAVDARVELEHSAAHAGDDAEGQRSWAPRAGDRAEQGQAARDALVVGAPLWRSCSTGAT